MNLKGLLAGVLLISTCAFSDASPIPGMVALERLLDRFEFMPEFHLTGDVLTYANHQSAEYRQRYFIETNSDMELVFVSWRELVYSDWVLYVKTGMGRQDGAVIFDPRDVRYGITPSLELRLKPLIVNWGWSISAFTTSTGMTG